MSMNSMFASFSVMAILMDALGYSLDVQVHPPVKLLSEFVSLTYWWPTVQADGLDATEYTHGVGKNRYHIYLQIVLKNFINKCQSSSINVHMLRVR